MAVGGLLEMWLGLITPIVVDVAEMEENGVFPCISRVINLNHLITASGVKSQAVTYFDGGQISALINPRGGGTRRLVEAATKVLEYWSGLREATSSVMLQLRTERISLDS